MAKPDFKKLSDTIRYTVWFAFKVAPGTLGDNREEAVVKTKEFLACYEDTDLIIHGFHDVSAMRAEADFIFWIHTEKMEDLQASYNAFLCETPLGQASTPYWSNAVLHCLAEFNKSHLPSFIMSEESERWTAVYPFIRSYDWHLLEPIECCRILAEHGTADHDYPDVYTNIVPTFALGDYEWILALEGPELDRIVDLMWETCYTEACLYVHEEILFHTDRRVDNIAEIINILPQSARYTRESVAPLVKTRQLTGF